MSYSWRRGIRRRFIVGGLATSALLGVTIAAVAERSDGPGELPVSENYSMTPAELRAFKELPVYSAGSEIRGHKLAAILRRRYVDRLPGMANPPLVDYVSVIYGSCERPAGQTDGGCAPPFEIQTMQLCTPHKGGIERGLAPEQQFMIRRAKAAWFEGGPLEVYTGQVTVRIFAGDRASALDAAEHLVRDDGTGVQVLAGQPLPESAADAALHSGVPCQSGG